MKNSLLTIFAFAFISFVSAQDYKFGKVSKEEEEKEKAQEKGRRRKWSAKKEKGTEWLLAK